MIMKYRNRMIIKYRDEDCYGCKWFKSCNKEVIRADRGECKERESNEKVSRSDRKKNAIQQ